MPASGEREHDGGLAQNGAASSRSSPPSIHSITVARLAVPLDEAAGSLAKLRLRLLPG
ncbi:hypothetical protein [Streptomyces sp. NBC_00343]|uniref:hypothetical protein n=1 Tax=Streptomyces sp. NBC_00343 TaxID=2975719 RepID=UPI002E2C1D07|nr:hypothetical protein [Streptomyces sp. NBC_00343]